MIMTSNNLIHTDYKACVLLQFRKAVINALTGRFWPDSVAQPRIHRVFELQPDRPSPA